MMDHSQTEDDATISSILGTLFSERTDEEAIPKGSERSDEEAIPKNSERSNEEAIPKSSERADKEAIATVPARLDEEMFEPLVEQGETPSIPTEEELVKYPELEYSSREVQSIVSQMDKAQKQEFRGVRAVLPDQIQTDRQHTAFVLGNKEHCEEMCPSMPGQMQDAVVEARAQLLAETKLKELCEQLGVPTPRYGPPPMTHPIDEGLLGEEAVPMSSMKSRTEQMKEDQPSTSRTVRRVVPTLITTEVKKEIKPQVQPRLLSDTMLDALGSGEEDCLVMRIKRGQDPFYDLTQDDEELQQAFAEVEPGDIPEGESNVDDLSVASLETVNEIESEEATRLLTTYADLKKKEAETLQDMVALIRAENLGPRQCYEIVKSVTKMEGDIPEIAQVREEFDHESVKLILAAGVRMKQVYDVNMKQRKKAESFKSIAKRFNVSKSRLYEIAAGRKMWEREKDVPKQVELNTPADTQTTTQVVKRHADDLGNNQSTKRQKGETSSTKKGGEVKSTTS